MRTYQPSNPQKSYIKAGVLLVLLIIVFIIADRLASGKVPRLDLANLSAGLARNKDMLLYDDAGREVIRKAVAGFWMTAPSDTQLTPAITVDDRVELKNNGIIWQVKQYRVVLPAHDTLHFTYVMTGYLMPHGKRLIGDSATYSDIRVLYQAMIVNQDSCYGESNTTAGWSHSAKPTVDSVMRIEGGRYIAYRGALPAFFPKGAIDLVKKININPCPPDLSFFEVLSKRVSAGFMTVKEQVRDTVQVRRALDGYYSLMLRQAIAAQYSIGDIEKTPVVALNFLVKPDGSITDVKVEKKTLGVNAIERFAAATLSMLKISPAAHGGDVRMTYVHRQM
jgi:hypothetical protein